jgi:hypothetical protein
MCLSRVPGRNVLVVEQKKKSFLLLGPCSVSPCCCCCFKKVAAEHNLLPGPDDLSVQSIVGTGCKWCWMWFVTLACFTCKSAHFLANDLLSTVVN